MVKDPEDPGTMEAFPARGIDIASLTDADKGRGVIYIPSAGNPERGILSSWNDTYIFARFTSGSTAAACDPRDLEWEHP